MRIPANSPGVPPVAVEGRPLTGAAVGRAVGAVTVAPITLAANAFPFASKPTSKHAVAAPRNTDPTDAETGSAMRRSGVVVTMSINSPRCPGIASTIPAKPQIGAGIAMSASTGPDVVTVRLMHIAASRGVVEGNRSPECSANVWVPIVTDPGIVGVGSLKARTVPHVAM